MTKRFEYTDIDGILKEAETFIASEFITVSAPNAPVKTLATGKLDSSLLPETTMAKAATLVIDRLASTTILRGDLVRASSPNHVDIADPTGVFSDSQVLGMALNDADSEEAVEVLILGIVTDALFSAFAVNAPLFLDDLGGVTDDKPTKPAKNFLVSVGKALGANQILINIQSPITLS